MKTEHIKIIEELVKLVKKRKKEKLLVIKKQHHEIKMLMFLIILFSNKTNKKIHLYCVAQNFQ